MHKTSTNGIYKAKAGVTYQNIFSIRLAGGSRHEYAVLMTNFMGSQHWEYFTLGSASMTYEEVTTAITVDLV
jgi:hypothetical protein